MKLSKLIGATSALTLMAGLAACSSGATTDGSTESIESTASITVGKPDGPISTEINNPFIGDSSMLRLGYGNVLFEPVAMVNIVDPTQEVRPWLASEIEWSDDYKSVTLTAREGVKWNDGTDFSAEDIAFTHELLLEHPELDGAGLDLKTVDLKDNKVTLTYGSSAFTKMDKILHKMIVPKHIWESVDDPTTFENIDPVGTGPYKLTQFTSQNVELKARDDYWGGELSVPTLYYVSYNDNTALTTALANGEADWAQAFIPNVESAYLSKDSEHNHYWAAPGLGIDAVYVNTTRKPFSDKVFRQAVNMVIDRQKHADIAREGAVPVIQSVTGLPTPVGDAFINADFKDDELTVNVAGAKQILENAGYSYQNDLLYDPEGEQVEFTLSVPQGWNDYVTGISLIGDSVKSLGVETTLDTPDADSWWEYRSNGEFDAILHWTDTAPTPFDLYSDTMDGRWLEPIGEAADYNFGRYDNPVATAALNDYANASDDETRDAALATIQKIFVDDVPVMPLGTRPLFGAYNTRNYVGWPDEDKPYASGDPTQITASLIMTQLKPAR